MMLVLWDNEVAFIEDGAFRNLEMAHLWLNRNRLTALGEGTFEGITMLRALFLDDNAISEVAPGALDIEVSTWRCLHCDDFASRTHYPPMPSSLKKSTTLV